MERVKILVVGCIFLFSIILPSIQGLNATNLSNIGGNIITVDNEGDGDYTSIKEALNNANPGDTIEVYSGTYYGNYIEVEKVGIIFQGISHELGNGSDTGKPFIDGNQKGNIFILYNKSITIDGFHIENIGDTTADDMIALSDGATNCKISNNELHHASGNIIFPQGSSCSIINNNISHSNMNGIDLYYSSNNNIVAGNNISFCTDGLFLGDSHNTITGNRITNCSRYGVDFATGDHSTFESNHVESNNIGLNLLGAVDVDIKNNNIMNNQNDVLLSSSLGHVIENFQTIRFDGNYWGQSRIFPKLLWGNMWVFLIIPITMPLNIDWHPAKEPYDI